MALLKVCTICQREKIIDTHCSQQGLVCFDCFDNNPQLNHQPDCRVEIKKRIERNKTLDNIHTQLEEKIKIANQSRANIESLIVVLHNIDPCPVCKAINFTKCQACFGHGYNQRPTLEQLSEVMPETRY
ncbi:hypothetical protein GW933_03690 [Candidatus Falkowbacteria bacterium]|uniref:Uncharacterized protein n=1 Tax=Candidatus Buchananbacteria bacterium CG10_big_fil_rev_8_21_14_0_10_33_19 TaxID=1974525 RepID=A0A2H0W5F3_9BACT|nr:hypothetical protein [Candidatus Falkowbacteria bacterium]PIS06507.1 MAG: hypothetical protein COT80_00045 [Candidatus Buchananbacteria bacterium CG10_big_fil_rev_8_21_14_0_10_33_19]